MVTWGFFLPGVSEAGLRLSGGCPVQAWLSEQIRVSVKFFDNTGNGDWGNLAGAMIPQLLGCHGDLVCRLFNGTGRLWADETDTTSPLLVLTPPADIAAVAMLLSR
ncbi:MAG: hypothetical protein K0M66_15530 [Thiobacillus sp.]|nr:hypothetical protein [Thiobacillus sp.]